MDEWVYNIYTDHLVWGEELKQEGNTVWCGRMSVEFLNDGRVIMRGVEDLTEFIYEVVYNEFGVVERVVEWLKTGDMYTRAYLDEKGEWRQEWFDEDDIELD